MNEGLFDGHPSLEVGLDHLLDEVFGFRRDRFPDLLLKVVVARFNFVENSSSSIAVERRLAAQQEEGNHSDRPVVRPLVILTIQHLWRDVIRCAQLRVH